MPLICSGGSEESGDCDCKSFVPKKSKKSKCKTCGHRLNLHSDPPTTNNKGQSKYVTHLVHSLDASAVHEVARKETLQGFRPVSPIVDRSSSSKGKVRARRSSAKEPSQSVGKQSVKFGRVVFFPCGAQNINRFAFPSINSAALEPWISAGLAAEADKPGFMFDLDWGTKEFNALFRRILPTLFGYFDSTTPGFSDIPDEPDSIGMKKLEYSLPYILLEKCRKTYSLVDATHPSSRSYKQYLAGDKGKNAGFRAKTLFLVTKERMPQEVIDEWFGSSLAPTIPVDTLKRRRSDSISVSSNSSEAPSNGKMETIPDELEDTEVEDVEVLEPPKKRTKRPLPKIRHPVSPAVVPDFVEGSSKDQGEDIDFLAKRLHQSASFQESPNPVWASDEECEMWNF